MLLDLGQSFLAVGGQPLDLKIRLGGKQGCERLAQDGVIVRYNNANFVFN